jgi:hypothetical protein
MQRSSALLMLKCIVLCSAELLLVFVSLVLGKLESAIESVLLADGYLREHLVEKYGFSVHRCAVLCCGVLWAPHTYGGILVLFLQQG